MGFLGALGSFFCFFFGGCSAAAVVLPRPAPSGDAVAVACDAKTPPH